MSAKRRSILVLVKPAIGIPECHDAKGAIRPGREYLYNDIAYARAVSRAGGTAFHLPVQDDPAALIDRVDALLLPGGDDFLPEDQRVDQDLFTPVSPQQLAFDRGLLLRALERGIPVFGICYGAQLLAQHFGASLHYHLPDDLPEAHDHQLDEATQRHGLLVEAGSQLARLLGAGPTEVNSLHHQAIADPGGVLSVCARSPDGVVEGIEHPGRDFCVGVQWHPEKLSDEASASLFEGFVAAAAQFASQ